MMRVGLISDTHGQLRPAVFDHFADVDLILHAGDVGDDSILIALGTLAPVKAVTGNTDGPELGLPDIQELELEGLRIVVVHGHTLGSPKPHLLLAAYPDADIIVYGHTHRPLIEWHGSKLVVNPGAAGPARFNLAPSVALLELGGGAPKVQLIEL